MKTVDYTDWASNKWLKSVTKGLIIFCLTLISTHCFFSVFSKDCPGEAIYCVLISKNDHLEISHRKPWWDHNDCHDLGPIIPAASIGNYLFHFVLIQDSHDQSPDHNFQR